MSYRFKASEVFWKKFYALPPWQKASTRFAWEIFKQNPFDPRLRTHKAHHLSAKARRIIYSVDIEGDLRAVFFLDGNTVFTFDIDTHDVYRE